MCLRALVCLLPTLGLAQAAPAAGGDIRGLVKSGTTPLPGVTVTAANTLTGQKGVTATDLNGTYSLHVPASGRYVVRAQMAAFAPATQEAVIHAANPAARVDFELVLLSRVRQQPEAGSDQQALLGGRGFQNLPLTQGENGGNGDRGDQVVPEGMPVPGMSLESPTESVAVSGNILTEMSALSSDEMRQRWQEQREQGGFGPQSGGSIGGGPPFGGSRGGGGAGGGPMIFGGGGRGRFNFNRPHGSLFYTLGDSALDATPYSLTGAPTGKPAYLQQRFGASFGGPLMIPKIYKGSQKTFLFVSYNGSRSQNPFDAFSTVPTDNERNGIFPVTIINPQTGLPFQDNTIPPGMISQTAKNLLPFIPEANLPGSVQNFHFVTSATSNTNDMNLRLMHSLAGAMGPPRRGGPRNLINFGLHFHSSDTGLTNALPSVGGNTSVRSFDIPVGYVRTFGKLTNMLRADFNRNRVLTQNLYAPLALDIAGDAGITGISRNPFDFGLPNLLFTNFAGVQDINPLLRRDQTFTVSDSMVWNHGKHTLRWGGDFRRIQINTETDSNARGSFTFTGLNTAQLQCPSTGCSPVRGTGFDFADFFLGMPQLTSVQFGANNYHFRGNSWDLFVQDEWRLRSNLTLNLGLRYEYVSPFTETNNAIVNLAATPGFTAVTPVLPGELGFPLSLVNPDRNNFAPRLGIAWKPFSKTVVRAGYGINYNTTQYANIVQQLAFQPPFSETQTNVEPVTLPLVPLPLGFSSAAAAVTNNYGVDPNYRLGYVQIWNLNIQRELRPDLVLNVDYTGSKGTHLDILEAPNRTATGLRIPGVQPFLWEASDGNSIAHAASVRLRKRLRNGVSVGGTYTFSKSIDNASSIGGGAAVVAQDAFDLSAERGLSSFDQQHRFTADYLVELPFGHDKRWLAHPGALRAMLGDWQWSGDWSIASGFPFTARVLGDFGDINRGTNGTLRADVTGLPVALPDPTVAEWFNTAAFVVPPDGQFGDAGRNTIRGPTTVLFNMAATKVVPLGDVRVLELRTQVANVFNTPQFTAIDTIVNSPSFGRVISTGSMRKMQIVMRFRF